MRGKWSNIKIIGVHASGNGHYKVGDKMQVEALMELDQIDPKDVSVQLYAGPINAAGEIERPEVLMMSHARKIAEGRHMFTGTIECRTSGRQGYALRVLPGCTDLATPFEPGLIIWN
jgi:starch phosphorylase